MRKSFKLNKKIYFLFAIVSLLTLSSFFIFGKAITPNFTFNLELLEQQINESPEECWKNPAPNRKNTMCNKLIKLQELIDVENFEGAYDKLLHDIKPKLTGLKTDEHERSWGNGVYKQAWITCEDLRETFKGECNLILAEINPLSVYDDDKTPPEITIIYEGEFYVNNPGVWNVDIGDTESGLDIVIINVNGFEEIYDLQGELSVSYVIPVPAIVGINTIVVTATNDDNDFLGDQETSSESDWVTIINTPVGTDVEVTDEDTGVDITFSEIIDVGITDVEESVEGPEPPPEFIAVSDYYEITTDAIFSGTITIAIPYDENQFSVDEQFLRLLHWGAIWNDITTDIDIANDIIYGEVIELSTFLIAADINSPLINNPEDTNYLCGSTGNTITWIATDENPGSYSVLLDGGDYSSGIWESGVPITINIDGLSKGTYEFTITVYDTSENYASDAVYVNVYEDDDSSPVISIEKIFLKGWNVFIEDLESGVDEILIDVNGVEYVHKENLDGIISLAYYNIYAQSPLGSEASITVTAKNNDKEYDGDQEVNIETDSIWPGGSVETDIDWTAPVVFTAYEGGYIDTNPGMWHIDIEDPETGLYEVRIMLNGVEQVYDQNLGGIIAKHYDIILPGIADIYTVTIVAKNNDYDHDTNTKSQLVDVNPDPAPPSDDDITGPTIFIEYTLDGYYYGVWRIYVEDLESGLDYIQITLDGIDFIYDSNLNGILSKFYQIDAVIWDDVHTIEIYAVNYDKDYNGDEELVIAFDSVYLDNTPPTIDISYQGDGTVSSPGIWQITVEDPETGIDTINIFVDGIEEIYDFNGEISILLNVQVPETIGTHTIEVTAINNDNDYVGDQESATESAHITIDDDNTAPIISIEEEGWEWNVFIEDLESGVDEILIDINGVVYFHEINLNGIISLAFYNIYPQGVSGTYTITVTAKNNDKDFEGDQEINTESDSVFKPASVIKIKIQDFTAPYILITYEGGYTDTNPGSWHIDIEDLESGLDEVRITLNGIEQVYDQNLDGIISMHYDIILPEIAGIYTITVIAINNDVEFTQDSRTKSQLVVLNLDPAPPSDDDITEPTIFIDYALDGFNNGVWRVYVEDLESGLDSIQILLDGNDYIYDSNLNGITSKFYQIDARIFIPVKGWNKINTIEIYVLNYDKDYTGDEELGVAYESVYFDNTPPTIDISYQGDGTVSSPGIWQITIEDLETGIDIVHVFVDGIEEIYDFDGETSTILNIQVPGTIGTHTIEVTTINNDNDYVGDQESVTESALVNIIELTLPTITISYVGDSNMDNPGVWNVVIEDLGSGIDTVKIYVDGVEIVNEQLGGIYSKSYDNIAVPAVETTHTITVIAKDLHQNEAQMSQDKQILPGSEPDPPPIIIG